MAHSTPGVVSTIRGFGKTLESTTHASNLYLLRWVDETVDSLAQVQELLCGLLEVAQGAIEWLKAGSVGRPIDPDDSLCGQLLSSEAALKHLIEVYTAKQKAAHDDTDLFGDYEDAVVCEYEKTLKLLSSLYNATVDLRWAVMEHDADLSELVGPFDDVEDLIRALNSDE